MRKNSTEAVTNSPALERKPTITSQLNGNLLTNLAKEKGADFGFVVEYAELEKNQHANEDLMTKFLDTLVQKKKLIETLNYIVKEEVRGNGLSLLREESLGSTLMKHFWFRMVGLGYLKKIIKPFVKEVYKTAKKPMEVDPIKLNGDVEKASQNLKKVLSLVQDFLKTFFASYNDVPSDFDQVLFTIYTHLTEMEGAKKSHLGLGYSEDALRLFGGFFLLRFICPAIVTPHKFKLMKEADTNALGQRALIIVSKILQSIANQVEFDPKKDPYMEPANDVIQWCMPQMLTFLHHLMSKIDKLQDDFPT